jgi:hypothetical protein
MSLGHRTQRKVVHTHAATFMESTIRVGLSRLSQFAPTERSPSGVESVPMCAVAYRSRLVSAAGFGSGL